MSTWIIISGIVLAIILFLCLIMGKGNVPFWKLVSKHPDAAFDWFMNEDCWVVVAPDENFSGPHYTGPFLLAVPKLGGNMIKVYAREDEIEDSQRRFVERYSTPSPA